ncbi:MAG: hypothetical protein ABFS39_20035 [Pseudomonadota bacterium]
MSIKSQRLLLTLFSSLLLSACSPYPGSGIWVPLDDREVLYSKLDVLFDGRAELFAPGRAEHLYRCFWSGMGSKSIRMECILADDENVKPLFTFQVAEDGTGELLESGQTIGLFRRRDKQLIRR